MGIDRRQFLGGVGVTMAAGASAAAQVPVTTPQQPVPVPLPAPQPADWSHVRRMFPIAYDHVDMSAMLLTAHPTPVAAAINRYRYALDTHPVTYLQHNNRRLQNASRDAIGAYLGIDGRNVALTDSTTMGVALVYQGLKLVRGQEVLVTDDSYYVTHESLRLAAEKSGIIVRSFPLADLLAAPSEGAIVERVISQIGPRTRVLALTWVHSNTGLKMPVRAIVDALRSGRSRSSYGVLVCVDGVHGFGCEDATLASLGCDFLMAGCHKWLFGPRGTGMIAGTDAAWQALSPTIPSFIDSDAYSRWIRDEPAMFTTAAMATPGGFKAFEHVWAIPEAFAIHYMAGKSRVAARTAELASQLKEGLVAMPNIILQTPRSRALSAGIVAFDVAGRSAPDVVATLRARGIVASVAPYRVEHVRLAPCIRNSPEEIERVLQELRTIAGAA